MLLLPLSCPVLMKASMTGTFPELQHPHTPQQHRILSAEEVQGRAARFTKVPVQELVHGR